MTATRAKAVVESYRKIKGPSAPDPMSLKNSQQKWEPPPTDRY